VFCVYLGALPLAHGYRFNVLHAERVQSAIDRYNAEVLRILGVLEGVLEGRQWLVGDKMTYADLAFVTWNDRIDATTNFAFKKWDGFPNVGAWYVLPLRCGERGSGIVADYLRRHERMTSRQSWKTAMEKRAVLMDEQGLQWNGMPKGINSMAEYQEHIKKEAEKAEQE
jgi:glutathione S-transferase